VTVRAFCHGWSVVIATLVGCATPTTMAPTRTWVGLEFQRLALHAPAGWRVDVQDPDDDPVLLLQEPTTNAVLTLKVVAIDRTTEDSLYESLLRAVGLGHSEAVRSTVRVDVRRFACVETRAHGAVTAACTAYCERNGSKSPVALVVGQSITDYELLGGLALLAEIVARADVPSAEVPRP
jgi:hypothetical protein